MTSVGSHLRQRRVGTVVSNRSDKTIVVRVDTLRRHPLYHKAVRVRSKLLAHDANNTCEVGDVVEIAASRPYSRRKRWRLTGVVDRATLTQEEREAIEVARDEASRAAEVTVASESGNSALEDTVIAEGQPSEAEDEEASENTDIAGAEQDSDTTTESS